MNSCVGKWLSPTTCDYQLVLVGTPLWNFALTLLLRGSVPREVPRLYPRILTQLCPRTRSRLCPRPFEWLTPPYHLWHLKHITYWRSRIAHAAHTSWSSWWWCSSLSCSWWPVRYHPHPTPTPPHPLVLSMLKSVLLLTCTLSSPPHPTPPFGLMYAQVCLAPDLYVIITTPPL